MKKSYRILQLQFYKGTIHNLHTENSPSRIQIYIQKTRELFEYYYYIPEGKVTFNPERNSTYRRQRDLLESIHALQDIPDIPVFPDLSVVHDIPAFQAILQVPSILQLECKFYMFYSLIGFHRKLHRVPVEQYKHYKHFILQRKGDVVISVRT